MLEILHLEDNPVDSEIFVKAIAARGLTANVLRVETERDFIQALKDHNFDLIVSDFSLPGFDGLAAFNYAHRHYSDIPFIFLSGAMGEEAAIESLVNGATDYVLKHKYSRLVPALQRALRESQDRKDRRAAEEAIHRSEAKYRRLFEESRDAIFIRTLGGQLLEINPAGIEMLGYDSRDEALAVAVPELFVDPGKWEELEATIASEGFVRDFEINLTSRKGALLTVLETTTAVVDEQGDETVLHGIWRDITDQRRLQSQFVLSQRLECVGQLAGGLAHDFNNLLTVALGYTQLSQRVLAGEEPLAGYLTHISKVVDRAASLTRQLLAFSRKQVLQPRLLSLNSIVDDIEGIVQPLLGSEIEWKAELASDLHSVNADAGQLEQVLMNLIINARDAMPHGGELFLETANVTVDADYARVHPPMSAGDYVRIAVSDSGTGMDMKTMERIFEPFFTTKDEGKGTGLGLSMVYGIVKQSGGYIWADTELGRGTTFTIFLPVASAQLSEAAAATQVATFVPLSSGSETILVIEDQGDLRDLMKEALLNSGYQVLTAKDGEEGLRVCDLHPDVIHLAVTDVRLPKLSGPDFVLSLQVKRPNIHVLYISGFANDLRLAPGPADQEVNFLVKPFHLHVLTARIRNILDGKAAA